MTGGIIGATDVLEAYTSIQAQYEPVSAGTAVLLVGQVRTGLRSDVVQSIKTNIIDVARPAVKLVPGTVLGTAPGTVSSTEPGIVPSTVPSTVPGVVQLLSQVLSEDWYSSETLLGCFGRIILQFFVIFGFFFGDPVCSENLISYHEKSRF